MSIEMTDVTHELNRLSWVTEAVKDGPGLELNQWTSRGMSGMIVDLACPEEHVVSLRNFESNLREALSSNMCQVAALNVILGGMAGLVLNGEGRPADILEHYAPKIGLTTVEAKKMLLKVNKPAVQSLIGISGTNLGMI